MSGRFDMVNNDCYRAALEIGSDFSRSMILRDECTRIVRDLTGYSARLLLFTEKGGTAIEEPEFTNTVVPAEGKITASALTEETATLTAGIVWYEWQIGIPGTLTTDPWTAVERILEGKFEISA